MTNIGAITVKENKKNSQERYIVCVADSMSSDSNIYTKEDSNQKLFKIGDQIVMGTGSRNDIYYVVQSLAKQSAPAAEEMAKAILTVSESLKLTEKNSLNFIVAGKDKDAIQAYHVNTTGNYGPYGQDYAKRGYSKSEVYFDGSGSKYVEDFWKGLHNAGKSIDIGDLTDAFATAYEFGKAGATSLGVNDKLQFAIISGQGVSRIYHPDIIVDNFPEYVLELTGLKIGEPKLEMKSKELEPLLKKRANIMKLFNQTFTDLSFDLEAYRNIKSMYTFISEHVGKGNKNITHAHLERIIRQRLEAKENVKKGVTALLDKGIGSLIGYIKDYNLRMACVKKEVLSYIKQQKSQK